MVMCRAKCNYKHFSFKRLKYERSRTTDRTPGVTPQAKIMYHPVLYRSDLVKSRRMLYSPDVCNCTMPYVPRTVPAYAVRDPAYTQQKCLPLH